VPGVGSTIARTLIAELPELGRLDRRIASLVGLAPWTRQSGQWKGKSFIGGGRTQARDALFMGALVAARHILRSGASISASSPPANQSWSPSSPSPESFSPSSTPSSASKSHGSPLDTKDSRSLL
jgi:Transposase IS116/IS110/IS902 family